MLIELLITLSSGLLVATVMLVISKTIADQWAMIRFRKASRGLPMVKCGSLLGNHAVSIFVGEQNCLKLKEWHYELGDTFGWLMSHWWAVSTVDLDLIKTIVMDENGKHMDRSEVSLPLEEFSRSIMLATKDEWRQLRKVIAPALA